MRVSLVFVFLFCSIVANAQLSSITGQVFNAINKSPLEGASIQVQQSTKGAVSKKDGTFVITDLEPGLYNLVFSYTGFETYVEYEIKTYSIKPTYIEIGLIPAEFALGEIVVSSEAGKNIVLSPLSVQKLQWSEIQRMPGATLDISKAIQSYPGVLPKPSFGYSIVVRGGAPNENSFYLDGIKIPAINHFSVQGANGGPNGLVNLDFVSDMKLYSNAFPVAYTNTLSSVMDISQRNGRTDRLGARFTLGATDVGLTLEGPIGKKSSYIVSARRSFSEYLLKAFDVPILPQYSDIQFKNKWHFNNKNELIITGIAGFDISRLNLDAEESDALLYNVGYIPEGNQKVYAFGANYKHYLKKSFYNFVVSQNGFVNNADKYKNNSYLEEDRLLKYRSNERENHIRFQHSVFNGSYEFQYGLNTSFIHSNINTQGFDISSKSIDSVDFKSALNYMQYGLFAAISRKFYGDKLGLNFGFRSEASNFSQSTNNPLNQLSPRLTASLKLAKKLHLKAHSGIYYQLPPNVLMAYSQANPLSEIKYIRTYNNSLGIEYKNQESYKVSIEGFYKKYNQSPFLLRDSIAYANAMGDYVVVGNQPSVPTANGRTYGLEVFVQQKLKSNYWWMVAYTLSFSEFEDKNKQLTPTPWDSRHFATITTGKSWKSGWQLGAKWRFSTGTPYTPYNSSESALISNWNIANRGIIDYNKLNQERLPYFHQLDLRVDKNWRFDKWNLNFFMDIQNLYGFSIELMPYLTTVNDADWNPVIDANDPARYQLQQINSDTGRRLYSIGLIAEF